MKKFISIIKEKNHNALISMDPELLEEAGECGYRSALILHGALSKTDYEPAVYSYEGPFGVGYLVSSFNLPEE